MESKKLRVFLKVIFLNLIFVSYISAENITTAPLINLDEIQPTYDEDSIDTTANNEVNSIATQNDKKYDNSFVTISLLNKITAEVISIDINLKQSHIYKELNIYPIDCYNSDPMDKRETAVYLNIYKQQSMEKIFNGWMIKSVPSVSSMEHPIYDIWVNSCYKL